LEPLLREADAALFPLSPTLLASLLDDYAKHGPVGRAVDLFQSLCWSKLNVPADHLSLVLPPPTRSVYTTMITNLIASDRWGAEAKTDR
jgi:hypothetical protein